MITARRTREPRTPHTWRWTLPLTLAILTTAAACSVDPGPTSPGGTTPGSPTQPDPTTPNPTSAAPASRQPDPRESSNAPSDRASSSGGTPVRVIVGGRTLTAMLDDNPTARDLADQLPLTLTFRDFNRVEKIAPLPRALTTAGVPAGADPDVNDIGFYAPSGDLVFYYGDVGYFNGIVRIGHFDTDIDHIRQQRDGFSVTIERAS